MGYGVPEAPERCGHILLNDDGDIVFTHCWSTERLATPAGLQHCDQIDEREQIRHTERRPPGGDHHERIGRDRVGPTRRDFSEPAFVVVEVHPVASPTVAVRDERVRSSEERMVRVCDPEGVTRIGGIGCS